MYTQRDRYTLTHQHTPITVEQNAFCKMSPIVFSTWIRVKTFLVPQNFSLSPPSPIFFPCLFVGVGCVLGLWSYEASTLRLSHVSVLRIWFLSPWVHFVVLKLHADCLPLSRHLQHLPWHSCFHCPWCL